jgi:hypothetical protein
MTTGGIEVALAASDEDYDPDDPGWRQQLGTLHRALVDAEVDIHLRDQPVEGEKGGVTELVLTLGTSGAISAAVAVLQSWLSRERRRQVVVTVDDGTRPVTYTVDGTSASDTTIKEIMVAALANTQHDG